MPSGAAATRSAAMAAEGAAGAWVAETHPLQRVEKSPTPARCSGDSGAIVLKIGHQLGSFSTRLALIPSAAQNPGLPPNKGPTGFISHSAGGSSLLCSAARGLGDAFQEDMQNVSLTQSLLRHDNISCQQYCSGRPTTPLLRHLPICLIIVVIVCAINSCQSSNNDEHCFAIPASIIKPA